MYDTSDLLEVRVNSAGSVEYVRNGFIVYTSTVSPTFPMTVDLSIYTQGTSINSLQYKTTSSFSAAETATNGLDIVWSTGLSSYLSQSSTTVTKSSSGGNSWNAGVAGDRSIPSGGYGIEFVAGQTTGYVMVGLTSINGVTSHSYDTIDFAMYPQVNGVLSVYESGTHRGQVSMYDADDVLQVRVTTGNQVEYVQNGIVVYTSTVTPSFPLTADCSIYTTSASFNSGKYITSAGFDSASSVSTNGETVDMSRGLSTYLTVSGGT